MLERPIQVNTTFPTVFRGFLIDSSALWTYYHDSPLSLLCLRLDQAMADGFGDGLRPVGDIQLAINILHLAFDLHLAPEDLLTNLFVGQALSGQTYQFHLSGTQSPVQAILLLGQAMELDDDLGDGLAFAQHPF